jgi:hypothetical protein
VTREATILGEIGEAEAVGATMSANQSATSAAASSAVDRRTTIGELGSLNTRANGALTPSNRRGGSGAWYAMELTELLPHLASGLHIDWDEAIRYAGLNAES